MFTFGRMHFGKFWMEIFWRKIDIETCYFTIFCLRDTALLSLLFRAVDHQWDGELFATAGAQVDIWNHNRF